MDITYENHMLQMKNAYDLRQYIAGLPGVKFDRKQTLWTAPPTLSFFRAYDKLGMAVSLPPLPEEAQARYDAMEARRIRAIRDRLSKTPEALFPYPVNAKLYNHQKRGANMCMRLFGWDEAAKSRPDDADACGFGLLFEMGLGKSITAIAIAGQGYLLGKVKRLLVVAPASVVPVWKEEFASFAKFPYTLHLLQGTAQKRVEAIKSLQETKDALSVAVINYEAVWRQTKDNPKTSVFDALLSYDADMIICDESQRIKTPGTAQSKALHKLGDKTRYKLILSGTPVQNSAMDVWSQYRFLDKSVFGDNFYKFRNRYAVMGGFGGKQIVAAKNMDELSEKAHSIALRATKKEALDLPEKTFINRIVEMSPEEKRLYKQIQKDCYAELCEERTVTAAHITTKLLRLQQITGGFIKPDDKDEPMQIGSSKLQSLKELLEDYVLGEGKKLVVFAQFTAEIHAICALLESMGIDYRMINGSVKLKDRGPIVEDFQKGTAMVMLGQIHAAGTGITLHAADTAVYYSLTYNYASYAQSTDRIHRIGQKHPCTYIHLTCPKTVDEHILGALKEKEDLASAIVDNWKQYFMEA